MWMTKKIIHSRLPKATLIDIFFTFLSYWKTDMHLMQENFYKKESLKECVKNHLKIDYVEF